MDEIARAYAVLGVRPGVSPALLRSRYKTLVKQWHPDRFASDPQGQAEATLRMRQINDAYRALLKHLVMDHHPPPPSAGPHANPSPPPMRRHLSREEIDRIVHSIGTNSPVDQLLDTFDTRVSRETWEHLASLVVALAATIPLTYLNMYAAQAGALAVYFLMRFGWRHARPKS